MSEKVEIKFDEDEIRKICEILREQKISDAYDDRGWEKHVESSYFRLKELANIVKNKLSEIGIYEEPFTP